MEHGGDLTLAIERFGGTRDDWLDLSTGINPYSYPLPDDLPSSAWTALPARGAEEHLIAAARHAYRIPDHLGVIAAPGTQILLSLLPTILPDGPVVLATPTYTSHKDAWTREGRAPIEVSSVYSLPADAKIVVLVNPNNPDGRLIDVKSLIEIAQILSARGGYLVVDEAFADVVPGASLLPHIGAENVLVLRSFGKFFGLAGLRIGFLAGERTAIASMSALLNSWCLSGPALEIGARALRDSAWQDRITRQLIEDMADLTVSLSQAGLSVFGGTPLYALAGLRNPKALHEALARRHIWTRIFDYAPTWIRFGLPGGPANMKRLTHSLAEALQEV